MGGKGAILKRIAGRTHPSQPLHDSIWDCGKNAVSLRSIPSVYIFVCFWLPCCYH